MEINYNFQRHSKLLKLENELRSRNKTLLGHDKTLDLELSTYNVYVSDYIFWEFRYQLVGLIENFLTHKINAEEFSDGVAEFRMKFIKRCNEFKEKLASEQINSLKPFFLPEEFSLSSFLTFLFCECQEFFEDQDLERFETFIQGGFSNFQNRLKEIEVAQNITKYDKARHRELLKLSQNLRVRGESLNSFDWVQLSKYSRMLLDKLDWESRNHYLELIDELLNQDNSLTFVDFQQKRQSITNLASELELNLIFLEPNYQALGFSNYIDHLLQLFDLYQPDSSICQNYELDKKDLKFWVKRIQLQIKTHYS